MTKLADSRSEVLLDNARLKEEVGKLRGEAGKLRGERNGLVGRVGELEGKYGREEVGRLRGRNEALEREVVALRERVRRLEGEGGAGGLLREMSDAIEDLTDRLESVIKNEVAERFPHNGYLESFINTVQQQQQHHPTEEPHSAMLVKTLGNAARTAIQQVEICRKEFKGREDMLVERIRVLERKGREGEGRAGRGTNGEGTTTTTTTRRRLR